jgi:hyperosmotically inducible protein
MLTRNLFLSMLAGGAMLSALAEPASNTVATPEAKLIRQIRNELVTLPFYGVFDNLSFRLQGRTVTLMGQVARPSLRRDAERAVKDIDGVENVVNQIETLPNSPNDDRIRLATFRAIYGHQALNRYALQAVPPIHIIVNNGNVTLVGMVGSEMDRNIANIQANQVNGVFNIKNELQIDNGGN